MASAHVAAAATAGRSTRAAGPREHAHRARAARRRRRHELPRPRLAHELCTAALASKLRTAFRTFRDAFPDWHQEALEFVTDGRTVVARMRCTGTHEGEWQGLPPTGRRMRIDEVYFFRIAGGRISGLWGLEDTWTRMRQLAGEEARLGDLGSLS